jgi:hypothetical protein
VDRRRLLKTAGATAAGLSIAGCLGGAEAENDGSGSPPGNEGDAGDEPIVPEDPGWFDIEGEIYEKKAADNLKITEHTLFRTPEAFGVLGTVKNVGNQPYTEVEVHARLVNGDDEVIDVWSDKLSEEESIDDLGPGEVWRFDVVFEEADPGDVLSKNVRYQVWATGEVK